MAEPRERLHALEKQLGEQEEELFALQTAKDAGLELTQGEAGRHGALPEMIAETKSEIDGERRSLGLDR